MKKINILLIVLVLAVNMFACSKKSVGSAKTLVKWISYDSAVQKAKTSKKHLIVDLYTDWCSWCKVLDKKVYSNKKIVKVMDKLFHPVKINAESDSVVAKIQGMDLTGRQLTQMFKVTGFPSTAFLDPDGKLIGVVPGYIPPEKFIQLIKFIGGSHYKTMKFQEYLKKNPGK
ncbi:MAG: DUF255 domain-containing protein [Spirochaetes bacterium]|nr:DUF255 domain-containing protein [Spirochaetota bacterium]